MDQLFNDEGWEDDAARQATTGTIDYDDLWEDDGEWVRNVPIQPEEEIDQFDDDFEQINPNGKRFLHDRREEVFKKRIQHGRGTGSTGVEPILKFKLKKEFQPRNLKRFKCQIYKKQYEVEHNLNEVDILFMGEKIDEMFKIFLEEPMEMANDNDQVSVSIEGAGLFKPFFISFKKRNFDVKEFVNKLDESIQSESGQAFIITKKFDVVVAVTRQIHGGRPQMNSKKRAPKEVEEISKMKRCVVTIANNDNACGYWSIALAKLKHENPSEQVWKGTRQNKCNRLEILARKFCTFAGVNYDVPMDRKIMAQIDLKLKPEYQIICIDANTRSCQYRGTPAPKQILIEFADDHYNAITGALTAYMDQDRFCIGCWVGYDRRNPHHCPNSCKRCSSYPSCQAKAQVEKCSQCNREFYDGQCFENHKVLTCKYTKKCDKCEVQHSSKFKHECNKVFCNKCKTHSVGQHFCYITEVDRERITEQDSKNKIIVAFDIESMLVKSGKYYDHQPNLLVAMICCDVCYDDEQNRKKDNCPFCGRGKIVFEGSECVKKFGDFIYKDLARLAEKKKSNVTVFAHNLKGYDGHFVFRDLFDRRYKPSPIMCGSKIMMIDIGNVRFIDSLNLFQMPLANLPKSFGFEKIALKGYFPHKFNVPEHQEYIGNIPDEQNFDPDMMSPNAQSIFKTWYGEQQNMIWSFKEEITKYCTNDTLILLLAVMKFRKLFKETTSIDPITRNFTLASIGLETYRSQFIQANTIGITPVRGYTSRRSSCAADAWVDWIDVTLGKKVSRENRLGPYFADAYDNDTNTIFEYNGCYYHGCPKCYPDPNQILHSPEDSEEKTVGQLFTDLQDKLGYYARHGYKVVSKWGCEINEEMENNPQMKQFISGREKYYKEVLKIGHANIRDSFFGGRTNNVRFHYDCQQNPEERIEYKDVTSEYPYVLKTKEYPIGHPTVIKADFDEKRLTSNHPEKYFGFAKCIILPPERLYLPVLPSRFGGKLMFVLCHTCGLESSDSCSHSESERALTGTWTTIEINKAVDKGYKIIKIIEILHYNEKSSNLFRQYIDMWLKVKQESSGWPKVDMTQEEKDLYVKEYEEKEGVCLDSESIQKNPGKRSIAKLMLNSFWGKLSQRPNLPKTSVCKQPTEYFDIHDNPKLKVTGEDRPNDDTVIVSYEFKEIEDADPGNTNIAIASFVTSYARLHLYRFMDEIVSIGQDRLLYYDTDSVIFVRKEGDPEIKTGNFLGDLTDELADYGPNARCVKFVSGGPKNYGYQIEIKDQESGEISNKTVIKTKGIKHDSTTLNIITMEKMTEMARRYTQEKVSDELSVNQLQFISHKYKHYVRTELRPKIYRFVSTKRMITGNSTLPFGYKM